MCGTWSPAYMDPGFLDTWILDSWIQVPGYMDPGFLNTWIHEMGDVPSGSATVANVGFSEGLLQRSYMVAVRTCV